MDTCIFCKFINKEIDCKKVYEDEKFFIFLDNNPVSKGHLLLITKKHFRWMQDVDDQTISEIFVLAKKMMLVLKKVFNCDYVKQSVVGEAVPHFHIHLIPRYYDHDLPPMPTQKYEEGEEDTIINRITEAL